MHNAPSIAIPNTAIVPSIAGPDSEVTITVFYSCLLCGLQKAACVVPAREDEDVRVWMDSTIRRVSVDHDMRSPNCHPDTLSELMIPMTGTDRIGGPILQ